MPQKRGTKNDEEENIQYADRPARALALFFALPMILGNLFQQFYNIADSVIVGNFVGERALAAVGASYAITNVFIALQSAEGSEVL